MTRHPRLHRLLTRIAGDRGDATIWGILIILVGLLLSGLVLDGGNAMAAKVRAWDIAQQAARAGANELDLAALREQGQVRLNPAAAEAAATRWLRDAGIAGTATATPTEVTVVVNRSQPTLLLAAVGIGSIEVTATAHATPVTTP